MKTKLNLFEEDQSRFDIMSIDCDFSLDSISKLIKDIFDSAEDKDGCYNLYNRLSFGIEIELKNGNDEYIEVVFSENGIDEFNAINDKINIANNVRQVFGEKSVLVKNNELYIGIQKDSIKYVFLVIFKSSEIYLNDRTVYNGVIGMHGKHSKVLKANEIVEYLLTLI